ncbi:hypothetical protein [Pseudofrankia sp. BMG5.37]|uniref:hypothetical protein n=1 Tax=Pseudofrankia sp. BMG5.37 TaxID=3050035 RepID=UPI002893A022|nr:hypothetical protein [Pseudofrankia sp. BMG5.37]MDT3438334.1 hypothetical protein [Pseudofrankia sp. BMG5.37]
MTPDRPRRKGRAERFARRALPFVLGAGAFAVAGVHTTAVAQWAGQPLWAAIVITGTGEAMAIAAVLEVRHRRRTGGGLFWPVLVTIAAFGFSAACNLTAALVHGDNGHLVGHPGAWRPVMAVWPVVAFALVTLMKATGGHGDDEAEPVAVPAARTDPANATTGDTADGPAEVPGEPATKAAKIATRRRRRQARPKRGTGRHEVAKAYAAIPTDDGRSMRQLAADIATTTGLTAPTVRKYLGEIATDSAAGVAA